MQLTTRFYRQTLHPCLNLALQKKQLLGQQQLLFSPLLAPVTTAVLPALIRSEQEMEAASVILVIF